MAEQEQVDLLKQGIVSSQQMDVKEIKISLLSVHDRLGNVEQRQDVKGLHDTFDRLEKLIRDRLPPP